jgi:hypothetical protein
VEAERAKVVSGEEKMSQQARDVHNPSAVFLPAKKKKQGAGLRWWSPTVGAADEQQIPKGEAGALGLSVFAVASHKKKNNWKTPPHRWMRHSKKKKY